MEEANLKLAKKCRYLSSIVLRFKQNTHIPSHQGTLPRVLETFCFQTQRLFVQALLLLQLFGGSSSSSSSQEGKNSENTRQIQIRWPRQQQRTVKMKKISTDSKCHFCAKKNSLFFLCTYAAYAWVQESWYCYIHSTKYFIQYRSKAIMLSLA